MKANDDSPSQLLDLEQHLGWSDTPFGPKVTLTGLTTLSHQDALVLLSWVDRKVSEKGKIYPSLYSLDGLPHLSTETINVLAGGRGLELSLNGLKSLSSNSAQALAQWKGTCIYMNGLTTLGRDAAKALSRWNGFILGLDNLSILSPEAAKALSESNIFIMTLGLACLSGNNPRPVLTAKALEKYRGRLEFVGTSLLLQERLLVFSQWERHRRSYLSLPGIQFLSKPLAQALASSKITALRLDGLIELNFETARILASWQGTELHLDGLTSLSPDVACALSAWRGLLHLSFNGLEALEVGAAQALSAWTGAGLSFEGLKSLEPDVVRHLVAVPSRYLYLDGSFAPPNESLLLLAEHQVNLRVKPYHPFFMKSFIEQIAPLAVQMHTDGVGREGNWHSLSGPALELVNGFKFYAIHGVQVPEHVVERPEEITTEEILAQENVEVRRIMLERHGWPRFLKATHAETVHQDGFGTLYRVDLAEDEPLVMVEVVNATPEPDGSFKKYWLRVPPETSTAKEAVAWGFGLTADQYAPVQES